MTAKVTAFKKDVFRVLKTILTDDFTLKDSEEFVDEKSTPMVCVSTDAGTDYGLTEYGWIQGKTHVKIDVYLSMGKTLSNNLETDLLQEKIRKSILKDPKIKASYAQIEFKKTAAISVPGESKLRVLTHDLEVTWTEDHE